LTLNCLSSKVNNKSGKEIRIVPCSRGSARGCFPVCGCHFGAAVYSGEIPRVHSGRVEARRRGPRPARARRWLSIGAKPSGSVIRPRCPAHARTFGTAPLRQRHSISALLRLRRRRHLRAEKIVSRGKGQHCGHARWMDSRALASETEFTGRGVASAWRDQGRTAWHHSHSIEKARAKIGVIGRRAAENMPTGCRMRRHRQSRRGRPVARYRSPG